MYVLLAAFGCAASAAGVVAFVCAPSRCWRGVWCRTSVQSDFASVQLDRKQGGLVGSASSVGSTRAQYLKKHTRNYV